MSDDREGAIRALEPFAKAFEEFGRWRYTDHEKKDEWFAFQDKNIVTPTMTMGDFRKAADTFASLTASKEAPTLITYDSERDWPEDAGHENGNYMCVCHKCKNNFVGKLRAALEASVTKEDATMSMSMEMCRKIFDTGFKIGMDGGSLMLDDQFHNCIESIIKDKP